GGVLEIPVDRIVGSVAPDAKTGDFDPGFLPVNRRMRERWTRIYQAMVEGDELPPIDVYKVDDNYYVIDGHHRVSVARNLGRPMINARVINVRTRAPLSPDVDPASLLRAAEARAEQGRRAVGSRPRGRRTAGGKRQELVAPAAQDPDQPVIGIIFGPPGSGKGTQAARIEDAFRLKHLSTGDILRAEVARGTPVGKEVGRIMAAGDLVPDELIVDIVRGRLPEAEAGEGVLLDGFPRTVGQAQ